MIGFVLLVVLSFFNLYNEKIIKIPLNKYDSDYRKLTFLAEDTIQINNTNLSTNSNTTQNDLVKHLINEKKVQYYTTIYVGSNNQPLTVLIDTGSNLLWLPSNNIIGRVSTNKYNYLSSSSFNKLNQSRKINYAKGGIEGIMVSDRISLGQNTSLSSQNFLLATNAIGIRSLVSDGVLGLNIDDEGNPKNSLIRQLHEEKIISSPSFALHLTGSNSESTLLLGDIVDSRQLDTLRSQMGSCSVPSSSNNWECLLESVNINDNNITVVSKVVFDSGSSYLIIPLNDFKLLRNSYINNKTCAMNYKNQLVCQCSSPNEFPDLHLLIDGHNISLTHDFLITYQPAFRHACRFNVLLDLNVFGSWVLGESALRGLLVSFNINDRKIGFVKTDKLPENIIFEGPKTGFNWWIILWILIAIVLIILAYMLYRYCFATPEVSTERLIKIH